MFLVHVTYVKPLEVIDELLPAHRKFLEANYQAGLFLLSGPREPRTGGIILANRILGFVNAPAMAQKLLLKALGSQVDAGIYAKRRDAMREVLDAAGYKYPLPKGAFYFFPQAPGGDDVAFVSTLVEERILAVPGKGFGCPGHFRLAFCVGEDVIRRSADGFKRAMDKVLQQA